MEQETILLMEDIEKNFGATKALQQGSFDLIKGEVHALLGANGAGKSTLIKILSGVYAEDGGKIVLDGKTVHFDHPKKAKEYGIYCVYQEVDTAIVPELSTVENIMLDTFASGNNLWVSKRKLEKKARDVLKKLQADHLPLHKACGGLTLAEKQLVLIARALVHEAKIIIFDEPTAPLSVYEAERLFQVISQLKKQGVGCIFISHRLPEIFQICDRVTVMREGRTVFSDHVRNVTQDMIIEGMLGDSYEYIVPKSDKQIGDSLISLENLSDGKKLHDISLTVDSGEIVGIAGLVGAGKTELAKAVAGAASDCKGTIKKRGKAVNIRHPKDAISNGIVLIPEERRKEGLFIHESIRTNATFPNLKQFSRGSVLSKTAETAFAKKVIAALQIKAGSTETALNHLSGGNQQKVAIGKWMSVDADVYLFDEPTKGVDIGAKAEIFKLIAGMAEQRKGILYFSSEIQELLAICDRMLVMCDGKIVKELAKEEATQEKILLYASGGKEEQHEREKHTVFI